MRFALSLLALILAAPTVHAQGLPLPGDGFAWERVGDRPIQPYGLAFGPDSTLWATAVDGPHRLDASGGPPGVWVLVKDIGLTGAILPLGRGPQGDTLLANTGFTTGRSTDGGASWAEVHDEGDRGLYEVPAGYPFAGRILTGDGEAMGYSDDRGATFTASVRPAPDDNRAGAHDFVAFPPGTPHAGRILALGRWGVNVSDDGGATFRESALWQVLLYNGEAVGLVAHAGSAGGVRAVMAGWKGGLPHIRVWASDDGGETWGPLDGVPLPEGPPGGPGCCAEAVLPLGGPSALVVLARGTVYRTDDGGWTWAAVGRAPEINGDIYLTSAALGPDGRLYVGLQETGPNGEGWVYRTGERVAVAAEPGPEPEAEPEDVLRAAVSPNPARGAATVTLTLAEPSEVEAAVYDVLGRRVALLHGGPLAAGAHAFRFDAAGLPAGVYVVRVTAGKAVAVRRLTLVR